MLSLEILDSLPLGAVNKASLSSWSESPRIAAVCWPVPRCGVVLLADPGAVLLRQNLPSSNTQFETSPKNQAFRQLKHLKDFEALPLECLLSITFSFGTEA